jgi:hypothetical protein
VGDGAADRRAFRPPHGDLDGGIIAIALAMGATAEEIARFDETGGPTIFPKRNGIQNWLGRVHLIGA